MKTKTGKVVEESTFMALNESGHLVASFRVGWCPDDELYHVWDADDRFYKPSLGRFPDKQSARECARKEAEKYL